MRTLMPFLVMTFSLLPLHADEFNNSPASLTSQRQEASDSSCRFQNAITVSFSEDISDTDAESGVEHVVAVKDQAYSASGIYTYTITDYTRVLGVELSKRTNFQAVIITDEMGFTRRLSASFLNTSSKIKLRFTGCN